TLHKSGELIAQLLALMSPSTFQLHRMNCDFFVTMRYCVSLRTLGFCSVFKELVCRYQRLLNNNILLLLMSITFFKKFCLPAACFLRSDK
ncbi:hypothetical protein, partial [Alkalicoccobacillus murimartini]|uniref:hypothetical protein n=1 Tax=Alkalicoccobacillus murimartini TaxID=171685 RepID=UPI0027D85257